MTKEAFSVRLRRALQDRDMTPTDLARRLYGEIEVKRKDRNGNEYPTKEACGRQKVHQWANGKREPSDKTKMDVAKELRMSVAELDPAMAEKPVGFAITPVDREGMVVLNISMRVPGNIGRAVGEMLRPWIGRA